MKKTELEKEKHNILLNEPNLTSKTGLECLNENVEGDFWVFKENLSASYNSRLKVNWAPTVEPDLLFLKSNWGDWVKLIQSICTELFENKYASAAPGSLKNKLINIKSIAQFMCFTRHRLNFKSVDKSDIHAYEDYLKSRQFSRSYVSSLLYTLQEMWTLESGLTFNPYPPSSSLINHVKAIGVADGHTPTLLPKDGLYILNYCLELVMNSEQTLEHYEFYVTLKEVSVKKNHNIIFKEICSYSPLILIEDVRRLYGAAIILLLSLSAMRKHEMSEIKFRDAENLISGKTEILSGLVKKTAGVKGGKLTNRETVPELIKAIEVVTLLTQDVRQKFKSDKLFLKLSTHNSVNKKATPLVELGVNSIYGILDLVTNSIPHKVQRLRPHMFRRFYAMMFVWRCEIGGLEYLSNMLFHNGHQFTEAYTEDEQVAEFLPQEVKELTYSLFEDILLHGKNITGGFSHAAERYKKLIQVNVTLSTPENASEYIAAIIERNDFTVSAAQDGYCFMSKKRLKRAKCSTDGMTPNYSNRNEKVCSSCSNFGVTVNKHHTWALRRDGHKAVLDDTSSRSLKLKAQKNVTKEDKRLIEKLEQVIAEAQKGYDLAIKILGE